MANVALGTLKYGGRGLRSQQFNLGCGVLRKTAVNATVLDLSGSAQTYVPIFYATAACTIQSITLIYQEGSGAGNCVVKVGNLTDDDHYYTGSTSNSQSIGTTAALTPLATAIPAGTLVTCANAGGSGAAGQVVICVEYTIDDE